MKQHSIVRYEAMWGKGSRTPRFRGWQFSPAQRHRCHSPIHRLSASALPVFQPRIFAS
jgi:hypothetical protein